MTPPHTAPSPVDEARTRRVVIAVMLAMFLAALDQTIVAPALTTIGHVLGDAKFSPWIISAYLLASTAATPLYGKASDIYGRRLAMLAALGGFLAGSVVCALAGTMTALIVGRAIQGAGGGGLLTLAQTVVADFVSPRERPRYTIYFSTVWATASIAGPALGGFLAQHLTWTAIFWINLPLGLLALAMCDRVLRETPQQRREHRLDGLGAALIFFGSIALMLALTLGGSGAGWTSPRVLALAAGALAAALWLVAHLARAEEPLLPLGLFANPVVGMANAALFCSMVAYIGATVYLPVYFEAALGADATTAGFGLIALLVGTVIGANATGRAMIRVVHYKRLAVIGMGVATLTLALLAALASRVDFLAAEALTFGLGVGLGPLFPVTTVAVQNAVDPRDLGVATATLAFVRAFGGAIAVAALGALALAQGLAPGASHADGAAGGDAVFGWLFAAEAAAAGLSVVFLLAMEERPLRGPAPPPGGAE